MSYGLFAALYDAGTSFALIDSRERRDYVAGQQLTIADFPTEATLCRYCEMPIERPELANVAAWYGRLSERDAYRRHVMVSFEEQRGWLAH